MILLQRIIFQIYKNKAKTLWDITLGAGAIDAETTTFAVQFIFRQIIIMCSLKIRKQMRKLNMTQACQGTETFGIVFMVVIIHATKIHAYAIYNKPNLH